MLAGCTPWPEEFARRYREAGLWLDVPLGELPRQWAREYGTATAVVSGQERLSYVELDEKIDRMAGGLAGHGLVRGDRAVVQMTNESTFLIVCFALFRLGVTPVFSLPAHRDVEVIHLIETSGAVAYVIPDVRLGYDYRLLASRVAIPRRTVRTVFVAGDVGEYAEFVSLSTVGEEPTGLPEIDAEEVAFFLLSGGTTGLPKLIPRTHADYFYQLRSAARLCELDRDTVYLAVLPMEFNYCLGCPGVLGTLHHGGRAVLALSPSPDGCFPLIERERVTMSSLVPTIAHAWVEAREWSDADLSSLEVVQIGSAKLHESLARKITPMLGCRLQQVFGMSEGLMSYVRRGDPEDAVLHTQGQPLSEFDELRVVDPETGEDVPRGECGELWARGPYTIRGYYNAPEHNAVAFTEDGFYRSGDLIRQTERGDMVVAGRIKDVINRGGDKVSATEVEGYLQGEEGIRQAAVVAMPDEVLGEKTCAFVIADGKAPTGLQLRSSWRAKGIADFKIPDRVELVDALPLTGLGKLDKTRLRADIAAKLREEAG
ncbi:MULTISPECIES: (2,3-dihydroxybenzoyl)adenylate synthase [Amycolatopsis]|uniref:(2,3-dihydroxybenzoyl)adenylate synthase n=1 Tax=Amycolatopsis albidoflavus TaxID=102226 RepID=A0ABW5IAA0_9PSEU